MVVKYKYNSVKDCMALVTETSLSY